MKKESNEHKKRTEDRNKNPEIELRNETELRNEKNERNQKENENSETKYFFEKNELKSEYSNKQTNKQENEEKIEEITETSSLFHEAPKKESFFQKKIKTFFNFIFILLFNPPIIGILLGVFISLIPFFKNLFFSLNENQTPILNFFMKSISEIGNSTITILLIILGIRFSLISFFNLKEIKKKYIFIIIFFRLILIPLFNFLILIFFNFLNFLPKDEILIFIIFLEFISPSNIDLLVIFQMLGFDVEEVGIVLFFCYFFSIFTMGGWLFLIIFLIELGFF